MQKDRFLVFILAALGFACASPERASDEYHDALVSKSILQKSKRTVVFFLVDGLGYQQLKESVEAKRLPALESFFLRPPQTIRLSQAVFPTLTYPNITSYLTSLPVDGHGVIANQILLPNAQEIDFTSPLNVEKLNRMIEDKSIFSNLRAQGKNSLSLDSYYRQGSTAFLHRELELGVAYVNKDYSYIDLNTLHSLERVLKETPLPLWPEFIFVHLIGVDSLGHQYGPFDPHVTNYLQQLDLELAPSFSLLSRAEASGHRVQSFLSADHGMVSLKYFFDVQKLIPHEVRITNKGRAAHLYFPAQYPPAKIQQLANLLRAQKGVDMVLRRQGMQILVDAPQFRGVIEYQPGLCRSSAYKVAFRVSSNDAIYPLSQPNGDFFCPEDYDLASDPYYSSAFVSDMAAYFNAPAHADAVVLAADATSFNQGALGDHGGITFTESLPPLLTRNIYFEGEYRTRAIPVFELFRFLRQPTAK